jgi:hypothetical protein
MLQYQPWEAGWRSRVFFAAGATGRTISTIKSKNAEVFQNGEVQRNEIAVTPARRTLVGGSFGVGFRVIDDYNIKTTPEIRYTYWSGRMFGSDSTRSPKNQIEIGIGFTF